MPHAEAEVIIS